ncbi:hypothetical protein TGFOU_404170 [Toxoplasma gondii FOU]|uniref:Uncharacterized protein n=1 Tax=Toxoplasma gondii FOU TaxID=943167 RepID=A0A086L804_TOXGO|nr:hypothetical protein TGFOU_404170 [Toxoplasma gondii FOU]
MLPRAIAGPAEPPGGADAGSGAAAGASAVSAMSEGAGERGILEDGQGGQRRSAEKRDERDARGSSSAARHRRTMKGREREERKEMDSARQEKSEKEKVNGGNEKCGQEKTRARRSDAEKPRQKTTPALRKMENARVTARKKFREQRGDLETAEEQSETRETGENEKQRGEGEGKCAAKTKSLPRENLAEKRRATAGCRSEGAEKERQ